MKRTAVIAALTALSLSAVEVRQDYFPIAVGNQWHYSAEKDSEGFGEEYSLYIASRDESSFTAMVSLGHPLMDCGGSFFEYNVTLADDGIITFDDIIYLIDGNPVIPQRDCYTPTFDESTFEPHRIAEGFGFGNEVYRNYYFHDDAYMYRGQPDSLIARDTFFLATGETMFTDVWGIDPVGSSAIDITEGEMFAQGVGPLGFDMDFSTKESYEVGHGGFQLDSMKIEPKPSVIAAESALPELVAPMDSSFLVQGISDSILEIQYSLTTGLYENSVVSSSYDEINNTLRIWLVDTLTLLDGMLIKQMVTEPGGYALHTLRVKNVDMSSDLNITIFHENRITPVHTLDEIDVSRPNPEIMYRETFAHAVAVEPFQGGSSAKLSRMSVNNGVISLQKMQNRSGVLRVQNLRGQEVSRLDIRGDQVVPLNNILSQGIYIVSLESFAGVENIKVVVQ